MAIQKSTNFKFSDLNTNITGNSSSQQISLSNITSSSLYCLDAGIYPANNQNKISMSSMFGVFGNTQQNIITTPGPVIFGTSAVAVSSDGSTIVVSSPGYLNQGFVTVYANNAGTVTVQGILQGSNFLSNPYMGSSVTISADGNTIAFGGPDDNSNTAGATWVFTRNSSNTWSQQGNKIVPPISGGGALSGTAVTLTPDGNTLVIGAPGQYSGNVYIYTRSSNVWTQQAMVTPTNGIVGSYGVSCGHALAISDDGNTIVAGGPNDNGNIGAAWIFVKNGSTWSQQAKLIPSDYILASFIVNVGASVAISPDGNTVAIGGPLDNLGVGATWIFTRSGTTWTQQVKLIGTGGSSYPQQGNALSLKPNGTNYTLLINGNTDGPNSQLTYYDSGGVWVYTGSGSSWTQQVKLSPHSLSLGYVGQNFGSYLALTANAKSFVASGGNDYIFGSFSVWNQGGSFSSWTTTLDGINPPQIGGANTGVQNMGTSVSISADGKTMAIGAPTLSSNTWVATYVGGVYIYTNTGNTWNQQIILTSNTITGNATTGFPIYEGTSVSLSADGNTLAIGGPGDNLFDTSNNSTMGATWIFTRSGTTWSQQQKLVGTGVIGGGTIQQGSSIAISADGNTLVVGGPGDNFSTAGAGSSIGAAWVFTRSGTTWTQQQKLVGTGVLGGNSAMGTTVAISADGNTVALGGPQDNSLVGAVWVFTRSGTTWTQQQKVVGANPTGASYQGTGLALSADGNTIAIGGYYDNNRVGAVWVFTRSAGTWTQQQKIVSTGGSGSQVYFGGYLSLSADGNTLLSGTYSVNGLGFEANGGAWIFTRSAGTWTQQNFIPTGPVSSHGFLKSVCLSPNGKNVCLGYCEYGASISYYIPGNVRTYA